MGVVSMNYSNVDVFFFQLRVAVTSTLIAKQASSRVLITMVVSIGISKVIEFASDPSTRLAHWLCQALTEISDSKNPVLVISQPIGKSEICLYFNSQRKIVFFIVLFSAQVPVLVSKLALVTICGFRARSSRKEQLNPAIFKTVTAEPNLAIDTAIYNPELSWVSY